ncbi:MAG: M42 family metallopeptidase [Gemmatimonadetes bacterium]|nr:M42 family metallopeptidase [Gemmatimonadota bacterium]
MDDRSLTFLKTLLNTPGPSGFEIEAARVWRREAEGFADRVWADVSGNSFALLSPGGRPRVMLAGHIDEIGLMVTHVDEHGFAYFSAIGGWDPEVLVGQRVRILTKDGPVAGAIGKKAIHLQEKEDRDKASKIKDLWIDIGARSGDEAKQRVRVGDAAVIDADLIELPGARIVSRSLDNRIGALVVLEALRLLADQRPLAEAIAVATSQEEIGYPGGGGARTSAFGLDPAVAIVVDVTHATDYPSAEKKEEGDHPLGSGPVLNRGSAVNPVLLDRLVQVAAAEGIAFTFEASPRSTGTDADAIYAARSGIATAVVSIPNRYMHSPNEMVALEDLERAARLIAAFVRTLGDADDFVPR